MSGHVTNPTTALVVRNKSSEVIPRGHTAHTATTPTKVNVPSVVVKLEPGVMGPPPTPITPKKRVIPPSPSPSPSSRQRYTSATPSPSRPRSQSRARSRSSSVVSRASDMNGARRETAIEVDIDSPSRHRRQTSVITNAPYRSSQTPFNRAGSLIQGTPDRHYRSDSTFSTASSLAELPVKSDPEFGGTPRRRRVGVNLETLGSAAARPIAPIAPPIPPMPVGLESALDDLQNLINRWISSAVDLTNDDSDDDELEADTDNDKQKEKEKKADKESSNKLEAVNLLLNQLFSARSEALVEKLVKGLRESNILIDKEDIKELLQFLKPRVRQLISASCRGFPCSPTFSSTSTPKSKTKVKTPSIVERKAKVYEDLKSAVNKDLLPESLDQAKASGVVTALLFTWYETELVTVTAALKDSYPGATPLDIHKSLSLVERICSAIVNGIYE